MVTVLLYVKRVFLRLIVAPTAAPFLYALKTTSVGLLVPRICRVLCHLVGFVTVSQSCSYLFRNSKPPITNIPSSWFLTPAYCLFTSLCTDTFSCHFRCSGHFHCLYSLRFFYSIGCTSFVTSAIAASTLIPLLPLFPPLECLPHLPQSESTCSSSSRLKLWGND